MTVTVSKTPNGKQNGTIQLPTPLVDYTLTLWLVFGGCCSNAWSLERLLSHDPEIGSALTFLQLSFIALHSAPYVMEFASLSSKSWFRIPKFKQPQVPLREWLVQVGILVTVNLLNNWAFAYRIPLNLQIVFRSGGLAVSMVFGWLFGGKKYNAGQIFSVLLVTLGVIIATLSKPNYANSTNMATDMKQYTIGIMLLTASLVLSGVFGLIQEKTYTQYGPHWREGLFYTHALSLPIFLLLINDIKKGIASLSTSPRSKGLPEDDLIGVNFIPPIFIILGLNLITQLVCVSGVNRLTSTVSSVSTNLVLTARKALTLCLSVWLFGSGVNARLATGGILVFIGTILYSFSSQSSSALHKDDQKVKRAKKE